VAVEPTRARIEIRAFSTEDREFLARIASRVRPAETASPREPAAMDRFFHALEQGRLLTEPGAEAFVATIDAEPCGLVSIHRDTDYFTGHSRAYVDLLVVAEEAECQGVGRSLMTHAERWAREHLYREVALDVFATNNGAIQFYERCGYRPDHIRMAKPVT
jgi:GNAT superfamily N-acetyltransferase